jgi:putative hydrolase of the HAD superfamily
VRTPSLAVAISIPRDAMTTIQALLFDADGVVIRPNRFAEYLAREHGLTREQTRDFFQGSFLDRLVGHADLKTTIAPFLAAWGWVDTVDAFLQRWFREEDAPDGRMLATISGLRQRGLPCYLATNQEHYRIAYMQTQMRFGQLFDGIFSSGAIGAMKHEVAFYTAVTGVLGGPPESILFWDDSAGNVAVARAYGWQAEQYTNFAAFQVKMQHYLAHQ